MKKHRNVVIIAILLIVLLAFYLCYPYAFKRNYISTNTRLTVPLNSTVSSFKYESGEFYAEVKGNLQDYDYLLQTLYSGASFQEFDSEMYPTVVDKFDSNFLSRNPFDFSLDENHHNINMFADRISRKNVYMILVLLPDSTYTLYILFV